MNKITTSGTWLKQYNNVSHLHIKMRKHNGKSVKTVDSE